MGTLVLKGNIVEAKEPGKPEIHEKGALILEDGVIEGVYDRIPERYAAAPTEDYGDGLILQSFADLHLHAPQYPMLGMGLDLPLLDWLDTYAFPAEARFADEDYAREVYRRLARELLEGGITRVCIFSSLHRGATRILMEELEKAGVTGFAGKVNMDQNGTGTLRETTEESKRETLRWLDECGDFPHVKPILTPRFIPSCSDELLAFLGKLAAERNLPIQSHLSENEGEIAWVKQLHPDCEQYWEAYDKFGLWTDRTLMAHCVHSDERERAAMRRAGVTAVHCADSNNNLCSGTAPVRAMLREGLNIALGSDIAGGDRLCGFDTAASAIRASKNRRIQDNWQSDFLTVGEAWYLATTAGARFFGAGSGFAPGDRLHAVVLDDDALPQPHPLSVTERFERCLYRRQKDSVRAVWSEGRKVLGSSLLG